MRFSRRRREKRGGSTVTDKKVNQRKDIKQ